MSYQAIIAPLTNVRAHSNADKLRLATVKGYQIVVGLENFEGEMGVFFPCDGQLSEEFATANDLIQKTDPVTGERSGGYFAKNRRVRSQRLRKEKSDGFWAPLRILEFTGVDLSTLSEGDQFDTLNGVPICNKYYTPATLRQMNSGTNARKALTMFPKHLETLRFQYEANEWLKAGALVHFTEKLHGSSARQGYVLETTPKPKRWYHKLLRRDPQEISNWVFVTGTRNVVLRTPDQGYYEDESFRLRVAATMEGNLHKGEVVYGEIVGYVNEATPVMAVQDTSSLSDVKKKYGSTMTYSYGCLRGECDFYVYRITHVNEDGVAQELSWAQVKARCSELNLKHVPELASSEFVTDDDSITKIKEAVAELEVGASTLDERHIREGVVIRVEGADGKTGFLKSKSFEFGVLEGYLKVADDYVDLEEIS